MLASTATMASISAGSVSRLRGVFIFRLRCYPDALPAIKSSPAFILFVALLMRFLLTGVLCLACVWTGAGSDSSSHNRPVRRIPT